MWRLVVEGIVSYTEVKKMTMPEIFEANAVLKIQARKLKEAREAAKNGNT